MLGQTAYIRESLQRKAEYQAQLNSIPHEGFPTVKDRGGEKFLYVRKRAEGHSTSSCVGAYSEEAYQSLLQDAKNARELRKNIREIEKELERLGYVEAKS